MSGNSGQKKNFWAQTWSTMTGLIRFGGLSPQGDVTSSVEIKARDGRHFFSMDEDGVRKGWTIMNSPGATVIHCGEDANAPLFDDPSTEEICEKESFVVIAKNGDIQLKAANGRIRMEAHDIEMVCTGQPPYGNLKVNAYESIKMDSKNITIDGKQSTKIVSTGLVSLRGLVGVEIIGSLIAGVSASTVAGIMPKSGVFFKQFAGGGE